LLDFASGLLYGPLREPMVSADSTRALRLGPQPDHAAVRDMAASLKRGEDAGGRDDAISGRTEGEWFVALRDWVPGIEGMQAPEGARGHWDIIRDLLCPPGDKARWLIDPSDEVVP
jgi:hypothetical protein